MDLANNLVKATIDRVRLNLLKINNPKAINWEDNAYDILYSLFDWQPIETDKNINVTYLVGGVGRIAQTRGKEKGKYVDMVGRPLHFAPEYWMSLIPLPDDRYES